MQASRVSFPVIFGVNFLLLNLGVTGVDVAWCWHLMRLTTVIFAVVLWRRRAVPEALLIIAFITPVLWLAAYPSANFMHQWWTASLTIPAFVYCVHLAVRAIAARLPRIAVAHQAWVTGAVLVVVFWSSASERVLAVRQRANVLTETLERLVRCGASAPTNRRPRAFRHLPGDAQFQAAPSHGAGGLE